MVLDHERGGLSRRQLKERIRQAAGQTPASSALAAELERVTAALITMITTTSTT